MINNITYKLKGEKKLFLLLGIFNFLITNIFLQISLLFIPIFLATSLSQMINILIGYFLYGKLVFKLGNLNSNSFKKYLISASLLFFLNYCIIKSLFLLGFNKNISAISAVPFLAFISYFLQKTYVFKK
tara:strand:- start:1306 stop:1692 length:387 start_codon:yes stop_codon:yes gene_type:complete